MKKLLWILFFVAIGFLALVVVALIQSGDFSLPTYIEIGENKVGFVSEEKQEDVAVDGDVFSATNELQQALGDQAGALQQLENARARATEAAEELQDTQARATEAAQLVNEAQQRVQREALQLSTPEPTPVVVSPPNPTSTPTITATPSG